MPVLVCLGNPNATTAVIDYLVVHGLDAERADDVDIAQGLLRFRRYDALVCDSEGATLARIAKTRQPDTRTVVLSTESAEKYSRDANVDFPLVKPLPLATILGCLA
jgi:hypothetical protein